MPQPKRGRGGGSNDQDLKPDALAPAPGEEGARLIVGVLGESDAADSVRLYLDLEFRKSYDVPADAIVRRQQLTAEQSPLGVESSALWVKPDTTLKLRQTEARRVEDEFLAGDFTAAGSFVPGPDTTVGPRPQQLLRPSVQVICPSLPGGCPNTAPWGGCASGIVRCSALGCPSQQIICQVTNDIRCQIITRDVRCQVSFGVRCPTVGRCPSIAGCPSDFICGGGGFPGGNPFEF